MNKWPMALSLVSVCGLALAFQSCGKFDSAVSAGNSTSASSVVTPPGAAPSPAPVNPAPAPSPSPMPGTTLAKACDGSPYPAGAQVIFNGQQLKAGWGAFSFSGPGPNTKETGLPCTAGHSFVISYLTPVDQFVGMVIATNATGAIQAARHVSFDIYVSAGNTVIATSAPYSGQPNDHLFWLVTNKQKMPTQGAQYPEGIIYPKGWTHMDFDVDLATKPAGHDNVISVAFEKWSTGAVTIAIDNLVIN